MYDSMTFTRSVLWLLIFVLTDVSQRLDANATSKPNVLIVLIDYAGYGDFGCHGHPLLKTPNIDKLYGKSIRLTDFHVAPMRTPTLG